MKKVGTCEECGAVDAPWAESMYTGRGLCEDCIKKEAKKPRAIKTIYHKQVMTGWCEKEGACETECTDVDICLYHHTHQNTCLRRCKKTRCATCRHLNVMRMYAQ